MTTSQLGSNIRSAAYTLLTQITAPDATDPAYMKVTVDGGNFPTVSANGGIGEAVLDLNAVGPVTIPGSYQIVDDNGDPFAITGNGTRNELIQSLADVGGGTVIAGGAGSGIIQLQGGQNHVTLPATGSGNYYILAGTQNDFGLTLQAAGPNTAQAGGNVINAASGNDTIAAGQGNNTITLGNGNDLVASEGNDTIYAGAGNDTVGADGASVVFNGSGQMTFLTDPYNTANGYSGAGFGGATVVGGTGSLFAYAATDNDAVFGGMAGNNILVAGGAHDDMIGGGVNNELFGSGGSFLAAGSGNETLVSGNTNNGAANVMFAGSGSNVIATGNEADTVVGGTGNDQILLGGGQNQAIYGSNGGNTSIFETTGSDLIVGGVGSLYVRSGSGTTNVSASQGANAFEFDKGTAGGSMTIDGFTIGRDFLLVRGYAAGEVGSDLAHAAIGGGNTRIILSDNTSITLLGVTTLSAASFV